jgi:chemotaxis methyl-accepting protein methylase
MNRRMKEYRISSFADLMQALRENPECLEELRRMVLTQELLELPKKFEEFRHRM